MKNILFCLAVLVILANSACTSLRQKGGGYPDSTLSSLNPPPASLAPPDSVDATGSPLIDETYLSSQADYHFTMGETLSYEGQAVRAIEEFKLVLIYDPKSVHVRLRLASEYVRAGMVTEAVEQGEIAVEIDPKSVPAHMLLGGLYSGLKMFEPARQQFSQVIGLEPGHKEASIYLGALLAEEQKYDDAVAYFAELAKNKKFEEPERAYYYIGRIQAERGAGYFSQAEAAFKQALEIKPEYPEVVVALAGVYQTEKKLAQMEKLLRSYQDRFGPEREMSRTLARYYLEGEKYELALEQLEILDGFERDNLNVKIQIALILIEQRKYEPAATRLEDILQLAPESDKVRYYLGAVYEELDQQDLAHEHYAKIPGESSYFSEAVVHRAHMYKTAGKPGRAIAVVEKAIQQQGDIPSLYAYYATLLDDSKDYKKALQMLTAAVEKFPANTQLRFFLGTMYDRVGDTGNSMAQMKKVIDIDDKHVQALNFLAYTYAELGQNLDEAMDLADRALKLQSNDGYILDTIGWIHFKKGEVETAIQYLEAALKQKKDEAIIAEHLGDAYLRYQMWQKAQKMYEHAAKLEGGGGRAKLIEEKLAQLQKQYQEAPSRMPASIGSPRAQ